MNDNSPSPPSAPFWGRISDNPAAILVLLLLVAFAAILKPSIHGNDGVQNYVYLRSLLCDGDLDFSNEYAHYIARDSRWFDEKTELERDPVTGRPINLYGVGSSLLWAPWVLAADAAGRTARWLGAGLEADGYSRLYESAVGWASCFYASFGLFLVFAALRRLVSPWVALWAVIAVWLASPLFFYMYLHPSMSHANSFFLAALLLWLYRGGDGLGRWAAMGLVGGLLALTRFQDAALLGAFAPAELWRLYQRRRDGGPMGHYLMDRLKRYALFGVCAVIAFLPQLAAWNALQGSPFSGPRGYIQQGRLTPFAPAHCVEVLFSSKHGLLFWHPALAMGVIGLLLAGKDLRMQLFCAAAFFIQYWVISSWSIWWAGASFGHRMFISALPFLAFGVARLLESV
ncbi:MAG: hypothetical protein K1X53_10645, partial [Candidatus Sumerlaeaceae bacterium]|nr:hypothetical protein [Candidatus Sumerlaeaceae bacterium]